MPRPLKRVKQGLRRGVIEFDGRLASHIGVRFERPALLSFLFHGVFESRSEVESGVVHPQEAMTTSDFRQFVEYFSGAGYRFVSVAEIEKGLDDHGRFVCMTFDDGYASTVRILDVLRTYSVPAVIFVSTEYIESGKRYWWDAVYDERLRRGASEDAIASEITSLEREAPDAIDRHLTREFGQGVTRPKSDLDRPLTQAELKDIAMDEHVTVGNHTAEHVVLAGADPDLVRRQLADAQLYLDRTLGATPTSVSYPEGAYDAATLETVRELGFASGFTTVRRRERLPVAGARLHELGRFQLRSGTNYARQLRVTRSELRLADALRGVLRRGAR
jgi:peptidoglycan/xylan/chitin deacetylase (PgdA/CDA1 family)